MKSKSTNILISLAALFSLLALIVRLVVFCGPQKFFVEIFGGAAMTEDYSNVSDPAGITKAIILFVVYLIVFIITVVNKTKLPSKIACIICIIVHTIFNILYPVISAIILNMFIYNQGAKSIAAYSCLNNIASYFESPAILLAAVFLSITLGTLMGKNEYEQQNY